MFIDANGMVLNDSATFQQNSLQGPMVGMVDTGGRKFEPNMLRPYLARTSNGSWKPAVSLTTNEYKKNEKGDLVPVTKQFWTSDLMAKNMFSPVWNAASLRKEDWIHLDRTVVRATRYRLRLVADLISMVGLGGFDAMSKLTHEYEAMTDPGEAVVDMDGLTDGRTDSPLFKLRSVPLPITHSDFWFSKRRIEVSRNSNTPLDTTMAEAAARRVAETIERTAIGSITGTTFGTVAGTNYATTDGTSTVYGLTTFPWRTTKTDMTTPTGANPDTVKQDFITMRETMYTNKFYGPFMTYYSTGYDQYFDSDYYITGASAVAPGKTLRTRIEDIDGIQGMRRLDFLQSNYQAIMLQMTSDVVQFINGMEPTTVQWESQGGLRLNFKVMAIQVPLFKAPYNQVSGVLHGTTASLSGTNP